MAARKEAIRPDLKRPTPVNFTVLPGVKAVANTSSGNVWGINRVKGASEMDVLAQKWGISKSSAAWLTLALDPFHDTEVPCEGLPDTATEPTFTFEVKKQVTISRPAGVTGPNWDCHIFNLPLLDANIMHQGDVQAAGVIATANGAADLTLNSINIICAESGADTLPNQTNGVTLAANDFVTGPDFSQYFTGPARCVALGFEVHNTTAELSKQGTGTFYRQAAHPTPVSLIHYVGTTSAFSSSANDLFIGSAYRAPMPPVNVDAAMLLPGSKQWEAREGCLCVVPFNSADNDLLTRAYGQVAFMDSDADFTGNKVLVTKNSPGFAGFASKPSLTVNTAAHTFCGGRVIRTAPLMQCGAYFTGLSAETTLTLTVKMFIERAPDASMPDLAILAKPSPNYEPRAFEIYLRTVHAMPPAVPVSMNPGGEWWKGLLSVANTAAGVGSMVFPQFAPAITGTMGLVNALAKTAGKKKKKTIKR